MAKKKGASKLDAEIGGLYALPLGEFTPARNALAARLKKEGDQEAAERVKGLAKPSVSAWAVNVLFRDERERMDALLAAGERARHALGEALTHGAAETLRGALHDERELRDELRRGAVDLLTEDGRAPGRAIVDRITVNLESLALSPAAAAAAERGWLDADLDPPGFEILAGLQLGAARRDRRGLRLVPQAPAGEDKKARRKEDKPAPAPPPRKEPPAPREDAVETKRRQREKAAREREETAERERREREEAKTRERIGRAEEKVARAAEEAESLRTEAERAERAATEAERAAEEARRRAEAARETAGRSRTRAERAAQQLARAEADLEGLR